MRAKNSVKNISMGILTQVVIALLGFLSRKVFLDSLGAQYLGINSLLDNVLSLLALVESGIGTGIVYNLYKPLAENDRPKIIALVNLYKTAYKVIAFIIFILSLILYPFLGNLMKDSVQIPYITAAYFIFVAKNMTYYLNAHKVSLINADQKGYVIDRLNVVFQVLITITKIIVLLLTKNYILYLIIELIVFILQNIINGKIVNGRYPYLKEKLEYNLRKEEKESLIKNVKALFLHNIGAYAAIGTDNLIISAFIGVSTVGLYSNYSMIIGQLAALVSPFLSGIGSSVGNLIVKENSENTYKVFKVSYLINFWIYSVCVIFLYNLLNPFIDWWLGEEYLLDSFTFGVLLINFYITGLRSSILTFKIKGGIFVEDKYMPIIEATINLVASIILVKAIGLPGIFLGTTISLILTVFWNNPRLVYKKIFKLPVWLYFKNYLFYAILTLISGYLTRKICVNVSDLIEVNSFILLILKGVICLTIPSILYTTIFYKSDEFSYLKSLLKIVIAGIRDKLKRKNDYKIKKLG
jgi:O-antigen/teichoic acid export membrane protein